MIMRANNPNQDFQFFHPEMKKKEKKEKKEVGNVINSLMRKTGKKGYRLASKSENSLGDFFLIENKIDRVRKEIKEINKLVKKLSKNRDSLGIDTLERIKIIKKAGLMLDVLEEKYRKEKYEK
jgi:hypothetical protein